MIKALGKKVPLLRALAIALGKDLFGKILKIALPRARMRPSANVFFLNKKIFAEGSGKPSVKNIKKNYLTRAGPR